MSGTDVRISSEQESRQVAEQAREKEWAGRTFLRELFLGKLPLDLIHPFPAAERSGPSSRASTTSMRDFLRNEVDSVAIDETGEYPEQVRRRPAQARRLRHEDPEGVRRPRLHASAEYCKVMQMVGSYDGNISALLSAHQSIGVPQPLKLFGTPEQKKKYLPRCAAGAISAFALTEPHVGSDPASLSTTAERDGDFFVLNGEKLWCTNGTLAELLVVMARDPKTKKISAFVVETDWPGVKVEYRCRFMGLKALANGVISFKDVRVPRENLIGEEGQGPQDRAHHAQHRPADACPPPAPASPSSASRSCAAGPTRARPVGRADLEARGDRAPHRRHGGDHVRHGLGLASSRARWPIAAATTSASRPRRRRSGTRSAPGRSSTRRCRSAAAAATRPRRSLAGRGETPIPVERMMRDCRINLIFEGSSEIMHLFMAREAVDKHLAGRRRDDRPEERRSARSWRRCRRSSATTPSWYPPLWLRGLGTPWPLRATWGRSRRTCASSSAARASSRARASTAWPSTRPRWSASRASSSAASTSSWSCSRCRRRSRARGSLRRRRASPRRSRRSSSPISSAATRSRKVGRSFRDLWRNDDARKNDLTKDVMNGDFAWLEEGRLDVGLVAESFQTRFVTRAADRGASAAAGS